MPQPLKTTRTTKSRNPQAVSFGGQMANSLLSTAPDPVGLMPHERQAAIYQAQGIPGDFRGRLTTGQQNQLLHETHPETFGLTTDIRELSKAKAARFGPSFDTSRSPENFDPAGVALTYNLPRGVQTAPAHLGGMEARNW